MPPPATTARDEAARRIRNLVAEGELESALEQLRDLALQGPRDLADEAFVLSGRLARLNRQSRKGTITADTASAERNRIAFAIPSLLDELLKKLPATAGPIAAPVAAASFAGTTAPALQSIIGINNLKQIAWLERGIQASRAVCRVLTAHGMGTGFLIGPRMLMTNNHVLPTATVARAAKVEFAYQYQFGAAAQLGEPVRYELNPAELFRTSEKLDYTVVAVAPADAGRPALESWGVLQLNPHADPVPTEHVVIVQHANGGPKQIALSANAVLQVRPPWLHYSTDTLPGSSGSPVFNDLWQVIALHHAEGPEIKRADGYCYSNEGVLMSAIRPDLGDDWPA